LLYRHPLPSSILDCPLKNFGRGDLLGAAKDSPIVVGKSEISGGANLDINMRGIPSGTRKHFASRHFR